ESGQPPAGAAASPWGSGAGGAKAPPEDAFKKPLGCILPWIAAHSPHPFRPFVCVNHTIFPLRRQEAVHSPGKAWGTSYLFPLWPVAAANFARQLSTTRYFPDPPGIGGLPKAPLAKGGCLGNAEAGGFRRQSLRNFLPIPSSLFPKKPSPFHTGLYFGGVPTVNPSVTAAPCQLPLAREPLGCSDEAPLAIVGVPRQRRGGGIPQACRFPHRFVL